MRNEALDCEVYALHAARSLKLHLWNAAKWDLERQKQLQMDLIDVAEQKPAEEKIEEKREEAKPVRDDFFDAFNRRGDEW